MTPVLQDVRAAHEPTVGHDPGISSIFEQYISAQCEQRQSRFENSCRAFVHVVLTGPNVHACTYMCSTHEHEQSLRALSNVLVEAPCMQQQ